MKRTLKTLMAMALAGSMYVGFAQDGGVIPETLVVGMVPSREADAIVDSLEPIAQMLEERLLIPVETFVSTNFVGLVEAMGTGRVHVGMFGPAGLVQAVDAHGAEILLASVRQGSTVYRSQFNVRCDSGIDSFEDLRGKTIAWVDPGSASGYQFPYVTLRDTYGVNPDTEMTGIFAGSHDAAMLAVYLGDVDVAVTFGGTPGSDGRTTIQNDYPDVMEQVCILGYSVDIPNDGMVVLPQLDDALKAQIAEAFIEIANTPEGKELTNALFNVTEFAYVEDPSIYDVVREVSRTFQR